MFISEYEKQYIKLLRNLLESDSTALPNCVIDVDLQSEFPVLKSRKVDIGDYEVPEIIFGDSMAFKSEAVVTVDSCITIFGLTDNKLHSLTVMKENDLFGGVPKDILKTAIMHMSLANQLNVAVGLFTCTIVRAMINNSNYKQAENQIINFNAMKGFAAKPQLESSILRAYLTCKDEYDDIRDFRHKLSSVLESIPHCEFLSDKSYIIKNYEAFTGDK